MEVWSWCGGHAFHALFFNIYFIYKKRRKIFPCVEREYVICVI